MTTLKLQFENEIRRVTFAAPLSGVRDVQARAQALFPALAARAVDAIRFTYVDGDGDTITVGCDADLREAIGQTSKLTVVATPVEKKDDVKKDDVKKDDVKKDDVKPDSSASTSAHPIAALLDAIKADPRLQGLLQSFGIPLDALSSAEVLAQLRSHPLFGHFIPPLGDDDSESDDNESDDDDSDSDDKEPVKPVVHNATCDGCQTRIVGLRFKCAACPDFDFCERCYTYKGESHPASHMFVKITEPVQLRCGGRPFWFHRGAGCPRGAPHGVPPQGCPPGFARGCPSARGCFKPAAAAAAAAAAPQAAPAAPEAAPAEPQPLYEVEHVAQGGPVTLAPGQQFVKLVKIKNVSNEAFEAASLVFASGDRVANVRVPIGKIGAGEERFVAIDVEAPVDAAGKLVSVYRLTRRFKDVVQGEPIVVEINVA